MTTASVLAAASNAGPEPAPSADRPMRVLFLTHRVPYAPNRGDRVRAFHTLRHLARQAEVEVVALAHDDDEVGQIDLIRQLGVRGTAVRVRHRWNRVRALPRLGGSRPLTHLLLDAPGLRALFEEISRQRPPDVILAYCTSMARFALEGPLDRFPLVIDFVDVDSEKWAGLARTAAWPLSWIYRREARLLSIFEARAAAAAHTSCVVNEREAALLRSLAPDADIRVIQIGVEVRSTPPAVEPRVGFCGVMNYGPNVEGVQWFVRDVWPRVRAARPDATFVVIGSSPVLAIRRLASPGLGIEVTGTVPEVESHLRRCALAVAPLRQARGVQNKVLEATGLGIPSVVTSAVADGLPPEIQRTCGVADTAEEFARHVVERLSLPPGERRALVADANLQALSWERQLDPLLAILAAAPRRSGAI